MQQLLDLCSCSWSFTSSTGAIRIVQFSIGAQKSPCILFITTKLHTVTTCKLPNTATVSLRVKKDHKLMEETSLKIKNHFIGIKNHRRTCVNKMNLSVICTVVRFCCVSCPNRACSFKHHCSVTFTFPLPLRNATAMRWNDGFTEDTCQF